MKPIYTETFLADEGNDFSASLERAAAALQLIGIDPMDCEPTWWAAKHGLTCLAVHWKPDRRPTLQ